MTNYFKPINTVGVQTESPENVITYNITKQEIFDNWLNARWDKWHSPNWQRKYVRDDKYLREAILRQLPVDTTTISISDCYTNWHNAEWWKKNIHNVIYILDNMYIKKDIAKYNGIYKTWFSRLVQFINTYIAEKTISETFGFAWIEGTHSNIHTGVATLEEARPDFVAANNETVELKLCENESSITGYYFKKLADNFERTKAFDFHGADIAMFCTKTIPHRLYTVKLDSSTPIDLSDCQEIDLSLIKTENGKVTDKKDLPAIPLSLMFGLTPKWGESNN